MTSSVQLTGALRHVKGFRGVFASDTLPDTIRPGESLIVNYDPEGRPGSHWVGMFHAPTGEGLYFDSFGQPPDADDLILHDKTHLGAWLRHNTSKPMRWNHDDLQALSSKTCGDWAAAFVLAGALPQDRAGSKIWRPLMRGSALERDARVKSFFDRLEKAPASTARRGEP